MSSKISNFMEAKIGDHPYLFLLFIKGYQTQLKEALEKQVEAFGQDMGPGGGLVVQKFAQEIDDRAHEIISKAWPAGFANRLEEETDPFMLIIDKDYKKFDPQHDRWAIIWFSDYKDNVSEVPNVLHRLAKLSREHNDIFAYVHSAARKKNLEKCTEFVAGVGKYFEFGKIDIPWTGVSIDVKAILADIAKGPSRRWWRFWRK